MAGSGLAPRVAVVIPVYKLAGLLCEAVTSCTRQTGDTPFGIVLVNDGCPHPQTDETCRQYVAAHATDMLYLRLPTNGGLAKARNAGARLAIDAWPSIEAVLFLDADDRLSPDGIARFFTAFRCARDTDDEKIGWVFCDPYQFGGFRGYARKVQTYSVLWHMAGNVCNPTSLISRDVFDEGIRFDETMRSGSEDWQFWMRLVAAGYRGAFMTGAPFFYRRRPESMMVDAMRNHQQIRHYVHTQTPEVFNRRFVLATEHAEHPRFALVVAPSVPVRLATDPALPSPQIPWRDFVECVHTSIADNLAPCPAVVVVAAQETIQTTIDLGLCHGLLWRLERTLRSCDIVALDWHHRVAAGAVAITLSNGPANDRPAPIIACSTDLVRRLLQDKAPDELRQRNLRLTISSPHPGPTPTDATAAFAAVRGSFADMARRQKSFDYRPDIVRWSPRGISREDLVSDILGYGPAWPKVEAGGKNIGFIVTGRPCSEDWVGVHGLAQDLSMHGWQSHLFAECESIQIPNSHIAGTIGSLNFIPPGLTEPKQPTSHYLGAPISKWMATGARASVKGLLSWLDVVFFWGGSPLLSASNEMDALVVAALPGSQFATPDNLTPIAYEHVIDLFVTPHDASADWLAARSVPRAKLLILPALARLGVRRQSGDPAHDPDTALNRRSRERAVLELVARFESIRATNPSAVATAV